jgi:outer membrane protein OmpA-like peptidoglycan-associated protein
MRMKHRPSSRVLHLKAIPFLAVMLVGVLPALAGQQDIAGAKDHPLVSRLEGFYIDEYEVFEFDSEEFYDDNDTEYVIQGRKWVIGYELKDGVTAPGQAKIRQNYINAFKKIGAEQLLEKGTWKFTRDGKEVWINLWITGGGDAYRLTIVERTAMKQEVVADPKAMLGDVRARGHAAVYGIYFDTDSAVIKPESEASLEAIAGLLNADAGLKLYVVGHTDMVGPLDHNMDLSARRAQSVVDALVGRHGIAPGRLVAKGVGPLCPVSTNATEDGRKLNRRVDLVAM